MSQTGLRLNWAEEFQHLACIYSLWSFGCSWWFPVDPQRVNCSGFGPCLPWNRRAWCSGAWLPQLGLSVKSSCDTQDWVIPSMRIRERDWVGRHMTGGASMKCENCMLGLNHHINYMKNRVFDRKFHFSQLFTALAEAYEIIMQNSSRDQEMTNTCLSQLNHTPPASPPPPRSHTTLQVWQLGSTPGQALGLTMGQPVFNGSKADSFPTKSSVTQRGFWLSGLSYLNHTDWN